MQLPMHGKATEQRDRHVGVSREAFLLGARKINERHGSLRQRIVAEHRSVPGAHRDEHRSHAAREILSGLCGEVAIQHRVPAYKPIALVDESESHAICAEKTRGVRPPAPTALIRRRSLSVVALVAPLRAWR